MLNRRIVCILLATVVLLAMGGCGEEKDTYVSPDKPKIRGQGPGISAFEQICKSWVDENGKHYTPDEFGGSYFNEYNCLVIRVVDGDEEFIERMKAVVDDTSVLEFETADISYNELCELVEEISELTSGIFESVGISQDTGTVNVRLIRAEAQKRENLYTLIRLMQYDHIQVELVN